MGRLQEKGFGEDMGKPGDVYPSRRHSSRALLPKRAGQSRNPACEVQQQTLGTPQAPGSSTGVDLDPPVALTDLQFLLLPVSTLDRGSERGCRDGAGLDPLASRTEL